MTLADRGPETEGTEYESLFEDRTAELAEAAAEALAPDLRRAARRREIRTGILATVESLVHGAAHGAPVESIAAGLDLDEAVVERFLERPEVQAAVASERADAEQARTGAGKAGP